MAKSTDARKKELPRRPQRTVESALLNGREIHYAVDPKIVKAKPAGGLPLWCHILGLAFLGVFVVLLVGAVTMDPEQAPLALAILILMIGLLISRMVRSLRSGSAEEEVGPGIGFIAVTVLGGSDPVEKVAETRRSSAEGCDCAAVKGDEYGEIERALQERGAAWFLEE